MTATLATSGSLLLCSELEQPLWPDFRIEQAYWQAGVEHVAGVDEAGRGPLAGPVVAAAVILDPSAAIDGLNDSKKLTARAREAMFDTIVRTARAVSVASVCARAIDACDIRKASLRAMTDALAGLAFAPDTALFDGRDIPDGIHLPVAPKAVIKGDGRSLSIAAASVVAKVTRDRMMMCLGRQHSAYGLEKHMGYGSQTHREAIAMEGGVARVHRFTFSPLKNRT